MQSIFYLSFIFFLFLSRYLDSWALINHFLKLIHGRLFFPLYRKIIPNVIAVIYLNYFHHMFMQYILTPMMLRAKSYAFLKMKHITYSEEMQAQNIIISNIYIRLHDRSICCKERQNLRIWILILALHNMIGCGCG